MEENYELMLEEAINKFTVRFYKETAAMKTDENLIMSPISAQIVLALLSLGAREKTLDELNAALHIPNSDFTKAAFKSEISVLNSVEDVTLNIANKIFVKDGDAYTIAKEFESLAADVFSAGAQNVNFANSIQAASIINEWVEGKTNNKIKDLITEDLLDSNTLMVLVNAVYFKGNWQKQFKRELTSKKQFHLNSNEEIEIDMMYQTNKFPCAILEEWDAQALKLNYGHSNMSMVIILPNQIEGMKDLEEKIATADLREEVFFKLLTSEVDVTLPKFKTETKIELNDVLIKLGMNLIFEGSKCDLSGLLQNNQPIYVSKVIQKAFIEVNEEGAEASAATGVIMGRSSCPKPRPKMIFCADHPFFYAIVAYQKPLFVGKFVKP